MVIALSWLALLVLLSAASLLVWMVWDATTRTKSSAGRLLDDEYWQARRTMNDAANQSWRNLAD